MRAIGPLLVLLAVCLAAPTAQPAPPELDLAFALEQSTLDPGADVTLNGTVVLSLPDDADCDQDLEVRFLLSQPPENATVTVEPINWTIPRSQITPGAVLTGNVTVRIEVAPNASAFDFLIVQVRAASPACGTMQAAQHTVQLTPRVTFLPSLAAILVHETADQWVMELSNTGNGAVDATWRVIQPSRGRVVATGDLHLANPLTNALESVQRLNVSKQGIDRDERTLFNVSLDYGGPHTPFEPPRGFYQAELVSRVDPASAWPTVGGILAGVLLAAGVLGWALVRRRRKRGP